MGGDSGEKKIHFVLVPFMAQGHMIPMVDLAFLLAQRGMLVTLVTTPRNASRFQTAINRSKELSLPVEFLALGFPSTEVGLPEGCENIDDLPSIHQVESIFAAARSLEEPLRLHLRSHPQRQLPTCILSDFCHPWTRRVSRKLGIPWLVFYSVGCFTQLCSRTLLDGYEKEKASTDESKPMVVPGIPHRTEVTKKQASSMFPHKKIKEEWEEGEATADGIVVNSFAELEREYVDLHQKAHDGRKVWTIGPLSLRNRDTVDMSSRGSKPTTVNENEILLWLDSMEQRSVTFVSLGSVVRTAPMQVVEVGLGLEASGLPFLWVVRAEEGEMEEIEAWLREGFEERNRGRGLVIRGWAPQLLILSHPSVGGFLTHCGWNSTLEGIAAGVPMATWPCFGDQFLNERFVLDVVGCGVAVGSKSPYYWFEKGAVVRRGQVEEAVRRLMDGAGAEAAERRRRASELGKKATRAVRVGGSSYVSVTGLIEDVWRLASQDSQHEGKRKTSHSV